jgi:zinc protease
MHILRHLILCSLSCIPFSIGHASHTDEIDSLVPNDSTVRIRTFSNGLTSYIKAHPVPSGAVELRLIIKAGSVNETKEQYGAAHVLARSALFGTSRFPQDSLMSYLRGITANAISSVIHVGYYETIYRVTVPSDSGSVNTAMSLLADWANGWDINERIADSARRMARDQAMSANAARSRTALIMDSIRFAHTEFDHPPLGTDASIAALTNSSMRQFQRDWYQTGNMAIVVVGDRDIESLTQWTQFHFGTLRKHTTSAVHRPNPRFAEPSTTAVALIRDPDSAQTWMQLILRLPRPDARSLSSYRWGIVNNVYAYIVSQRLGELQGYPDVGITRAQLFMAIDEPDGANVIIRVGVAGNAIERVLTAVMRELAVVGKYGVTPEEMSLWRQLLRGSYEEQQRRLAVDDASTLASKYTNHFVRNIPFPTTEDTRVMIKDILKTMTASEVSRHARAWLESVDKALLVGVGHDAESPIITDTGLVSIIDRVLAEPLARRSVDSSFRIVDLKTDSTADLTIRIKREVEQAEQLGYTPVVEFGAVWCLPCRLVDVTLHHPRMRSAFERMYIIRIDVDEWQAAIIKTAGFSVRTLPAFFAVNRDGRPTGMVKQGVEAGNMDASVGNLNNGFVNAASVGFETFFRRCREKYLERSER